MSLSACIAGLVAEGRIAKGQAAEAERAYAHHFNRLKPHMGMMAAAAEASEAALQELEYKAALRERQILLQVGVQKQIAAEVDAAPDRNAAALAVVERVDAQRRAVLGRLHQRVEGVLARHSRNLAGAPRDKSGLNDLGRERFGEATGNLSAKELAAAFGEAAEYARLRFNRGGGAVGKREDWGLPQHHDTMKVRAVPYQQWRADLLPALALERMTDDATGQPFTPDSIEAALKNAYDAIRSDGWTRREAGGLGRGKLANSHSDHRFFVFRDFAAWNEYREKYGSGTLFDAMIGHLDGMARDIAMVEQMGPNPAATLKWLQDKVKKAAAEDPDPGGAGIDRARSTADVKLANLYAVVSGELNAPVSETWARRFGGVRSFLTSALLGSTTLVATPTDIGFGTITRAYNGLPVTRQLGSYLKLLNPLSRADRRVAVRLGLIAEEASKIAASLNRYIDGVHGPEVAMRLSDAVMRLSGLAPWTQAARWAFGMETLGHLADVRGTAWDGLESALRAMMERYGIDAPGWDAIRASEPYRHRGAEFLRPDDVADEALGDKMLRMVLTETDYAVPTATARARSVLSFGQRPGTLGGEIVRNGALFKSFGVSMILTHGARMMEQKGWNRAKYFAGLTVTTTLLGGLALQLTALAKGRDAQDMSDGWFWARAALKGGGYGIFGDFIGAGANENRFGGGFAETLAGPVVGAFADLARSGGKMIADARDPDKEVNAGKEVIKLAKRYVPGGTLWYARAAYERLVLDQLAEEIDPDYHDSWRRMEDRAAALGQEYYWRPGDLAPERPPRMAETPD
ncbi:MAG TPA: hypothetical protein VGW34_14930 [Allosphingosinicella sp.]|nr:hypothetical protein [Allosphingosinicella sp.]